MVIFTHVWVSCYETKVFCRLTVVNRTPGIWGFTITVETKIEAQIMICSHSLSLYFFLHQSACCLIGDDWNPVMEH